MTKQQKTKEFQGYTTKVVPQTCSNCQSYQFTNTSYNGLFGRVYDKISNQRCGVGGFVVKRQGGCNYWTSREVEP